MKKTERKLESIKELEKLTEKPVDSWIFKYFYRKISIYFTKLFLYLGVSANQVSILSGIVGIPSVLFFAFGDYYSSIIGAVLVFFWMVFDCSDGQAARYNMKKRNPKKHTLIGGYMDTVMGIVHPLAFVGIAFGSRAILGDLALILGFSTILSIGHFRILLWQRQYLTKSMDKPKKPTTNLIQKIFSPLIIVFGTGIMVLLILTGAILNSLHLLLLFYGITFPIFVIGIIIYHLYYGLEKTGKMMK